MIAPVTPLGPRETEVAKLLCEGLTLEQVAAQLGIAPGTADTHRTSIYRKLGIRNRIDLHKWALRSGLVEVGGG